MPEDPFAPLEDAVRRAGERLSVLADELAAVRAERDDLRRQLDRARDRLGQRQARTDRLEALESERASVRRRIEGLLGRLEEAGIGDRE